MKIINREEFLKLPANTLFSKYEPCVFGGLEIKADGPGEWAPDFLTDDLTNTVLNNSSEDFVEKCELAERGEEVAVTFSEGTSRDGLFDKDQLFAVYSKEDVKMLVVRLIECL